MSVKLNPLGAYSKQRHDGLDKQPPQTADVVIMRACGHRETVTLTCREKDRNVRVAEAAIKKCRACRYGITVSCRDEFTPALLRVIDLFNSACSTIVPQDVVERFRRCVMQEEVHEWLPLTTEQIKHHFSRRRLVRGRKTK